MKDSVKVKIRSIPSPSRIGLNHNIEVGGIPYHIQTEDLGPRVPQIVTHVFAEGGRVVKVARLDYSKHLGNPSLTKALPKVVRAHHRAVTRKLVANELDRLEEMLVLRPSTEAETAITAGDGAAPPPEPVQQQRRHSTAPSPAAPARSRRPSRAPRSMRPRSPASIWNQLVQEAHRQPVIPKAPPAVNTPERLLGFGAATAPTIANAWDDEPPSSSHSWDQAVLRAKLGQKAPPCAPVVAREPPGVTLPSFEEGQKCLKANDVTGALVHFAHCVQLEPTSRRYRAALQQVLAMLEE